MGNEKEIYSLNKKTSNEIDVLKMKINILNKKMDKIQNICNHSIVFSLSDSSQYKNTDSHIEMLFCPACSKTIKSINKEINDMSFCHSEIIDLTNIDLESKPDAFYTIENETIKNFDYYYDSNVKSEFKALSMINALKDKVKKKDL